MSRVIGAFAICVGVVSAIGSPRAQQPVQLPSGMGVGSSEKVSAALFDQLYQAYAAGDRDILEKSLTTAGSLIQFHASLLKALDRPPNPKALWTRMLPAFLLEVAVFSSSHDRSDVTPALSRGRVLMTSRPMPSDNPTDDAFEVQWHRTALAVLQQGLADSIEQLYLDTLDARYLTGPAARRLPPPIDPHFVLDRAIAEEQTAFRLDGAMTGQRTPRLTALVKPNDKSKLADALRNGLKAAQDAAELPEVATEARIRETVLLVKLGRFEDALAAIRTIKPVDLDDAQRYWATLVEARVLHELKRLPEAERVYRQAAAIWTDAPAPATGLSLVLFEMNRRDEAAAMAASVRSMTSTEPDPWWTYITADARFIHAWRDQVREMLK